MSKPCPKCDQPRAQQHPICPACGLVFAKFYQHHDADGRPLSTRPSPVSVARRGGQRWAALEALIPAHWDAYQRGWRALLLALLALWSVRLLWSGIDGEVINGSFLHGVNLLFHEAGHVIFGVLGRYIGSLGGSLGQLLMPLICAGALLRQGRDPFGALIALWWFGENLVDLSPYINDARARVLPLLGGHTGQSAAYGYHDWEYLLGELGLLNWDHALARLSFLLGAGVMLAALASAARLLRRAGQRYRQNQAQA